MAGHRKYKNNKYRGRLRRKASIRKKIRGTAERPRLSVFRSLKHIYAQAIDDDSNVVVASASDSDKELRTSLSDKSKKERAHEVGKAVAERLMQKKVGAVVFDRNGYFYHGRVREVAEGAREGGLKF